VSYVGSKTKIMCGIEQSLPQSMDRYFEPFLGGGSMMFKIAGHAKSYHVNDLEQTIIDAHTTVKSDVHGLLRVLSDLNRKYRNEDAFHKIVDIYNDRKRQRLTKTQNAALLIYLLKLSFNSNLKHSDHKVFPSFSTSHAGSNIYSESNLLEINNFFRKCNVTFSNLDHETFLSQFKFRRGDFVFLDPPYTVDRVKEFYSSTDIDYKNLLKICQRLDECGVNWMMTLNNCNEHKKLFKQFKIRKLARHSFISNGKCKDAELIITNY
jgi:DNA adenine methylase